MERQFKNIARVIKDLRIGKELGFSQGKMAELLKYKNGQFISNIERGLCSIPAKTIPIIVKEFGVSSGVIIGAMVDDYRAYLKAIVQD